MDRFNSAARPLDALCDDIVERYHAVLHRSLPAIREELAQLCAESNSSALAAVRVAFGDLADQIESHLAKEEHLLFPAVEALAAADREGRRRPPMPFVTLMHPIRLMETEHARIEALVDHVRDLVLEVAEPDSLLPRWRRCLLALARLDRDLQAHHRYEASVLFPLALDLDTRLPV